MAVRVSPRIHHHVAAVDLRAYLSTSILRTWMEEACATAREGGDAKANMQMAVILLLALPSHIFFHHRI